MTQVPQVYVQVLTTYLYYLGGKFSMGNQRREVCLSPLIESFSAVWNENKVVLTLTSKNHTLGYIYAGTAVGCPGSSV